MVHWSAFACYYYYYFHTSEALAIPGSSNYSQVCDWGPRGEKPGVQAISSPDQLLFL